MRIGSSLKIAMDQEKITTSHGDLSRSNKITSSNKCSNKRRSRTTSTSTTSLKVAWTLTVLRRSIIRVNPTRHSQSLLNLNLSSRAMARAKDLAILLFSRISSRNRLTATHRIRLRISSSRASREPVWADPKVSKTT